MGLYQRYIGPRLVSALCAADHIADERRKIVPQARGVVVEIGIGPGLNLPLYDPAKVKRVIGIDPSEGFVALGERRRRDSPVPVMILRAPAEAIPLADDSTDTAVLTYTLCSVDDPAKALQELRRVLKPTGRLLFLEHGRADETRVVQWQNRLNPLWRKLGCGCNLNRDAVSLIAVAGFAVEAIDRFYLSRTPRPIGFHFRGVARAR
jgi:ubiquinone/menaquinone biosynthesis C-methylase UbiE